MDSHHLNNIFSIFPYGRQKKLYKFSSPSSAYLYFRDHRVNLLNKEQELFSIDDYLRKLDKKKLERQSDQYEVHHFYYELSDIILFGDINQNEIPLSIEIIYTKKEVLERGEKGEVNGLRKISAPRKSKYQECFDDGINELMNGNSYQFNFTNKFKYSFDKGSLQDFVWAFENLKNNRGQFAHFTHIPYLGKIIFSNSPEGLFQLKHVGQKIECITTPIKGTLKRDKKIDLYRQWKDLKNDRKNQGELFMIIDLLRNDLSSIEEPISKVIRKKALVLVPGLIHQMGVISVSLSTQVSIGKIIRSLFPGGSITGAPKKSTYNILKRLESQTRGNYTGSTLLIAYGRSDCSINIRTAEIDLNAKTLEYGSGGGITLLSHWQEEFQEMNHKVDSFVKTVFKS